MTRLCFDSMRCVLSIDVEDWFHILDVPAAPDPRIWDSLPSRVEDNLLRLLAILDRSGVRGTFFFLGWIAERHPDLVRAARDRGHEIASHGYAHRLACDMSEEAFRADALRARTILEQAAGVPVRGYRASGFSLSRRTPWFHEALGSAGYAYDSSLFPARHGHGGIPGAPVAPHRVPTSRGAIVEFPVSVAPFLGRRFCFFGGGYFRLAPYPLIANRARKVQALGRPVIFYLHPRELDPEHPRLPMSWRRRFKTYVNLRSTETKLRRLLAEFRFVTFAQLLDEAPALKEGDS